MSLHITRLILPFIILFSTAFTQCKKDVEEIPQGTFVITDARVGTTNLSANSTTSNIPVNQPIVVSFNQSLNTSTVADNIVVSSSAGSLITTTNFLDQNKTVSLQHAEPLVFNTTYTLQIGTGLKDASGNAFPGKTYTFTTEQTSVHIDSLVFNGINVTNINNPQNVPYNLSAVVYFDRPINPATLNTSNVRVFKNSGDPSQKQR